MVRFAISFVVPKFFFAKIPSIKISGLILSIILHLGSTINAALFSLNIFSACSRLDIFLQPTPSTKTSLSKTASQKATFLLIADGFSTSVTITLYPHLTRRCIVPVAISPPPLTTINSFILFYTFNHYLYTTTTRHTKLRCFIIFKGIFFNKKATIFCNFNSFINSYIF